MLISISDDSRPSVTARWITRNARDAIEVAWKLHFDPNNLLFVTSFQVAYVSVSAASFLKGMKLLDVPTNHSKLIIDNPNLLKEHIYRFTVTPYYRNERGKYGVGLLHPDFNQKSVMKAILFQPVVVGEPLDFSATAQGNSSIYLMWNAPKIRGSRTTDKREVKISGYKVIYHNGVDDIVYRTTDRHFVFRNLNVGDWYYFTVKAEVENRKVGTRLIIKSSDMIACKTDDGGKLSFS